MATTNIGGSVALLIDSFNIDGVVFTSDSDEGNVFVDFAPSSPDSVVVVTVTSNRFEMGFGMERERISEGIIQVRDVTQWGAFEKVSAIVEGLHAFRDGGVWDTLDGGTVKVISVNADNYVFYGFDDNNLPQYFIAFTFRWVEVV